jgi:uncharacterized phage protein (TIGR02218 family)
MTSFDTLESSVESSRPIELYQITIGSDAYRYTSAEDEITADGNLFEPIAIARNSIEQGSDSSDRTLSLTVPATNPFAMLFVNVAPGERATVTAYRYQRDESPAFDTTVLIFKGTVQSVRFSEDGTVAEIAVRSIETALNRTIPRFSYMGVCNHFLYDQGCKADPSSFNHIGVVTAETNSVVTVTGASASGLDFVGGYMRPVSVNDFRMILAQSGDQLTILLPFPEALYGGSVQCFAGCDHIIDSDCALIFDNVINFGGFPFVPARNVFETGLD